MVAPVREDGRGSDHGMERERERNGEGASGEAEAGGRGRKGGGRPRRSDVRGGEWTAVKAVKYQSRDGSCHRRANIMGGVLN